MDNLKIVFLCIFCGNPYAELLVKPFREMGFHVEIEESNFRFFFLPKIMKDKKPDVLHIHTLHYFLLGKNQFHRWIKFFIFIIQIKFLMLIGTKVVWTVHEWIDRFDNGKNNIHPLWATIIGKKLYAIITHNNTMRNEIIKAMQLENTNKVFLIPHGNYLEYYENKITQLDARKIFGISSDSLLFLLFGNLHRSKGFLEAIDAFKALDKEKISLLIAGYPAEDQIEELIKDKIKGYENISFVPKSVPDEEIQVYMNACDCVIVPYKVFTTSGVTILAMSFGKACIAPNIGFFRDVLDDSGAFLYDSTHEDGLLKAMKSAIEKRDKISDMGKHNLRLAEQWSWQYVAEETIKVYQ